MFLIFASGPNDIGLSGTLEVGVPIGTKEHYGLHKQQSPHFIHGREQDSRNKAERLYG